MYAWNEQNRSLYGWDERHAPKPAHMTFGQIARILAQREHVPISSEQVEQICHRAEAKLLHALLADEQIHSALHRERTEGKTERESGGTHLAAHRSGPDHYGRHGRGEK